MRTEDEVARDLRHRYAAVVPDIAVDPAALVREGRRRRTARVTTALLTVAAVLAIGLVGRDLFTAPTLAPATPPPPEPVGEVSLWLDVAEVRPGDQVTAILTNTGDSEPTFGMVAEVEVWTGSRWRPYGEVGLCLDEWQGCTGEVVPRLGGVEDIGYTPTPEQPGPVQWFTTAGLDPGWYRIGQQAALDAAPARAVLEVTPDARPLPPPAEPPLMSVMTGLVPPDGGLLVAYGIDTRVPNRSPGAPVPTAVERWTGDGWRVVAEVDAVADDVELKFEVPLPALDPGTYRLRTLIDRTYEGRLWVVDDGRAATLEPIAAGGEPDDTDALPDTGPCAGRDPVTCAYGSWLEDTVRAAGYVPAGGDHDVGNATQSIELDDGTTLGLALGAVERWTAGDEEYEPTVQDEDVLVGEAALFFGTLRSPADGDPGSPAATIDCGGFRLTIRAWADATPQTRDAVAAVAADLAEALQPCPADEDALLADATG